MGLALSGLLRRRRSRSRAVSLALGLNLAAFALLGVILASGTEAGGLAARWSSGAFPAGLAALVGLAAFRFPRSVGLPLVVVVGVGAWLVAGALRDFHPLEPGVSSLTVQPLTDREMVTAFGLRADTLEIPPGLLPGVPVICRLRPGSSSEPGEWWWSWAVAQGWARSSGAALPDKPMKFGLYRLTLADGQPTWTLEIPELAVPSP